METIRESDGLPSPNITGITQDSRGMIWVASKMGLAFHNGLTWEKADLGPLTSFSGDGLLETDPLGDVWALISGSKPILLHQHLHNWQSIPLPNDMADLHPDFTHFALTQNDDRIIAAIAQQPNSLHVSTADGWLQVPLAKNGITDIKALTAMDDNFILATPQGVFSIPGSDPSSFHPLLSSPLPNPAGCLCVNHLDDSLWMVGDDWIGKLVQGVFEYLLPPQGGVFDCFSDLSHRTCQTDGFGGIYLAGAASTQYYHPQMGMEIGSAPNGFMEFGTTDFFLDRELVLWQGTTREIHKIFSRHLTGFNSEQGLLADEVTALLRRREGALIVGHNNGLTIWNGQKIHLAFPENDSRDRVLDLAEDSLGNVWIAGRQRGLGRLSPDGSLRWWPVGPEIPNYTSSVLVDDAGRIWIAAGDKLVIMDNGKFTEFPVPSFIEKGVYLRRLIKGRDGTIFVATGNRGVFVIKGNEFQQWTTGLRDHGNSVYDILETSDAVIWVGTRNGLYQLAGDRLVRPSESHFDFNQPVYFLETDQRNRIWVGTDNGVFRIDGSRVAYFSMANGLLGRETNRCAGLVDPGGKIWVGTERGLTLFNDLFENTNPLQPLANPIDVILPSPIWQRTWFLVIVGLAFLAMLSFTVFFMAQRRYSTRQKKDDDRIDG